MSRPIRHEKGLRARGQATTLIVSKPGRSVPGKESAAACSGNSPDMPPTATILAVPVHRSLQVFATSGLIIVTDAPVSIRALIGHSGNSSPTSLPSSTSKRVALTRMGICGPSWSKTTGLPRHFTDGTSVNQVNGLLCRDLLHQKTTTYACAHTGAEGRRVVIVEPLDSGTSNDHESTGVRAQPILPVLFEYS
jgi:hypothetical protein